MKPASDMVQAFEYAHPDPESERSSDKYDNRDVVARSLGGWATVLNTGGKITMAGVEFPANEPTANLAEGYATAFER